MIGFSMVCGLLYTPWMIDTIGKGDYGLYVLVTSFLTYFTVDFGLFNAVNKVVARCRAQNDIAKEQQVIGMATKIYLIMDCFVCLAVIVAYFFLDRLFDNLGVEELAKFKNVYLIAGLFCVLSFPFNFLKGVYSAHELFVESKLFDFALKIGTICFTVLLLYLDFGLYSLVLVHSFMPFIINVSKVFLLNKKGIRGNYKGWDKVIVKEIFSVSLWLFGAVVAELFINNISPTILAARSTTTQVAVFGIAWTLYGYIYSFSQVINGMFLPKVTELHVQGASDVIHQLCYRVARIILYTTGFVALGFIAVGKDFIMAWVGPDFINAYYVAVMLLVPQLLLATVHVEQSYLIVADKIKFYTYTIGLSALITIFLSIWLSDCYGAIGVGLSIFVSTLFVLFGGRLLVYHRYLKFSIKHYIVNTVSVYFSLLLILVIYFVIIKFASVEFSNAWITFFARSCILVSLYLIAIPFVLNKQEKQLIWGNLKLKRDNTKCNN